MFYISTIFLQGLDYTNLHCKSNFALSPILNLRLEPNLGLHPVSNVSALELKPSSRLQVQYHLVLHYESNLKVQPVSDPQCQSNLVFHYESNLKVQSVAIRYNMDC